MFWRNKEKRKSLCKVKQQDSKYFWGGDSDFIHNLIKMLQGQLDQTDNDIRLEFVPRYSFPHRYWKIQIEFPDGKIRKNTSELDEIGSGLLKEFSSCGAIEKAVKILYWFSNDSRNVASVVKISYVLAEKCGKLKIPGVIIYWPK